MEKQEGAVENRRYLTTQNVADLLQVRVETVRNYIKQGKLPAAKLGRDYRIAAEDVERLLQPRLSEPGAAYHVGAQMRQDTPGIVPAEVKAVDLLSAEPAEAAAEFDVWAVTQRMATGYPYTPEEIAQAEREMHEIIAELRANPPHPTITEFMEASRGYAYDPD